MPGSAPSRASGAKRAPSRDNHPEISPTGSGGNVPGASDSAALRCCLLGPPNHPTKGGPRPDVFHRVVIFNEPASSGPAFNPTLGEAGSRLKFVALALDGQVAEGFVERPGPQEGFHADVTATPGRTAGVTRIRVVAECAGAPESSGDVTLKQGQARSHGCLDQTTGLGRPDHTPPFTPPRARRLRAQLVHQRPVSTADLFLPRKPLSVARITLGIFTCPLDPPQPRRTRGGSDFASWRSSSLKGILSRGRRNGGADARRAAGS